MTNDTNTPNGASKVNEENGRPGIYCASIEELDPARDIAEQIEDGTPGSNTKAEGYTIQPSLEEIAEGYVTLTLNPANVPFRTVSGVTITGKDIEDLKKSILAAKGVVGFNNKDLAKMAEEKAEKEDESKQQESKEEKE